MSLTVSVFFILAVLLDSARPHALFQESFTYESITVSPWSLSESSEATGQFALSKGDTPYHGHLTDADFGLLVMSPAQRHAISFSLEEPFIIHGKAEVVFQYEVRLHNHLECGGAYLKFLSNPVDDAWPLNSTTPYSVMFGPDKCGPTDKVHFIFRHQSPVTKKYTEHHAQNVPSIINDRFTHLYGLTIYSNQTYTIQIDGVVKTQGNLLSPTDFSPALIPSETIPDPADKKPSTWNDQAKIPDPNQVKPDDWDESQPEMVIDDKAVKPDTWDESAPLQIPDPDAQQPDDWSDEDDGKWVAPLVDNPVCSQGGCSPWSPPLIKNPNYKGKWKPDLIDNPDYSGVWTPRQIPNPNYFTTTDATEGIPAITSIAVEIWTMQSGIEFDNIFFGESVEEATKYAAETWSVKHDAEVKAHAETVAAGGDQADDDKKIGSSWLNKKIAAAVKFLTPFLGMLADNPYSFLATFLAGVIAFIAYMWKQAGAATGELRVQANTSKTAIKESSKEAADGDDQDGDEEGEDDSEEDDEDEE